MSDAFILRLDDSKAELPTAGGKGASLARLAAAGVPVPSGFHITTAAYRAFLATGGLSAQITSLLGKLSPDDTVGTEQAAASIAAAFADAQVPPEVVSSIWEAYSGRGAVAVRSSATAEDLPEMSFAGQHDTFLGITGPDAVLDAVKRCWASLWTARAIVYRARNKISYEDIAIAVVVQDLVPAAAAGVMFTADPMTGDRDRVVINAAWGLGESLVSGQVTPDGFTVAKSGALISADVHTKTVMTVPAAEGTAEKPVPEELRDEPVLTEAEALELAQLGIRIEKLYGTPVDVEWAAHDGRFVILQARPITTLPVPREVWNDSLLGDYLWTSGNVSEAVPSVMTPVTWSVIQELAMPPIAGHPTSGNIGGRFYLNLSTSMAVGRAFGMEKAVRQANEQTFGRIDVAVPPLPLSRFALIRAALPVVRLFIRQGRAYRKNLRSLLSSTPSRCAELTRRISACTTPAALLALWKSDVDDLLHVVCQTLDVGARQLGAAKLGPYLTSLVGEGDAALLLTGSGASLASLGPVLGLAQLRDGSLSVAEYAQAWGHRGPDEYELSAPRPAEDPEWISRQRDAFAGAPEELLAAQASARALAWERLVAAHPDKAPKIRKQLDKALSVAQARERSRSEMVRTFGVFRAFVVKAGSLTGHGSDLFFLTLSEILSVLDGSGSVVQVPVRRAAYEHYKSLPPYPTLIRGAFDPETWQQPASVGGIKGFPGAAGVVEGVVRVVSTVEEAEALRTGEVLVTTATNIGWTPLFPRAAAVVTDVGAPLSHAAIVARELGIPAVVGCGNATSRLSTGDRVRVDGALGVVTVL
ncbi:PEP/pyruvate-binding domain-containing protein [Actinocrispum sp. NPDC049592]|uniref:PEP/pyruvate-binding domain-containing protein n=1 Tax=Actinocrispum sp. NPDC049592 TaxID=3154835 RepID=UPI00342C5311